MGNYHTKQDSDVELSDDESSKVNDDCLCPVIENPKNENMVCGSNGITYASRCEFKCDASHDEDIKFKSMGSCEHPLPVQKNLQKIRRSENEQNLQIS